MGEEGGVGKAKRAGREPMVKPERCRRAIKDINNINGMVSIELVSDDFQR
jgi:hypothetical protein